MRTAQAECAYGDLSPAFTMKRDVRQGCLFNFLLNFVIQMVMEEAVSPCENSDIDIFSERNMSN